MIWQKTRANEGRSWPLDLAAVRPHGMYRAMGRAPSWAMAAALATAAACAGPVVSPSEVTPADDESADTKVTRLKKLLAEQPNSPLAAQWREELQAAGAAAQLTHVDAANRHMNAHDLASAEAELALAANYSVTDTRYLAAKGRVAELRGRCAMLQGQIRGLLMRLEGKPYASADAPLYAQLLDSLEFLLGWQKDYPGVIELRDRAAPLLAGYKAAEARAEWEAGNADAAQARLAEAERWKADHPAVVAARKEQQQHGALAAERAAVRDLLAAGNHTAALARADQALVSHGGDSELVGMRRKAARVVIDGQLAAAVTDLGAGQWAEAAQKVAQARFIAGTDPELQKGLEVAVPGLQKPMTAALAKRAASAQSKGWSGSAWWYGQVLAAVLGADAKRDAGQAKLLGNLSEAARFHVTTRALALDKPVAAALAADLPAAVVQQSAAAMAKRLLDLGPVAATVNTGKSKQVDGLLQLQWPKLSIERTQAQQKRTKEFLDHTELVDNPEWALAQSKMSAELAKLNAATDEARPLRDTANVAESKLFQLQGQFADVKRKIAEEDKATYANTPSPCADGKLECPQTKAHLRWRANLEYYERRIAEESAKLAVLAPKLRAAQEVEEAAQKRYDAARDIAEKTSRKIPNPVYLPYSYEVTQHRVKIAAQIKLGLTAGTGKTGKPLAEAAPGIDEVLEDFASDTVMIKGQVLEPQHVPTLPDDASLTTGLVHRLVEPAMQPVLDALSRHAGRFVAKADAAKTPDEQGHWLALAWLSRAALGEPERQQVVAKLAAIYGYDPATGALKLSVLVPPPPPKK